MDELAKKIASLNDLKDSIQLIKAHMQKCEHGMTKAEGCKKCEAQPVKKSDETPSTPAVVAPQEEAAQENPNGGLKVLGIEPKGNGEFCHVIGCPGSTKKYKIMVDTKPLEHIILVHHHIGDSLNSVSPTPYKTLDSAAKSVVNHFHKGEW